MSTTIEHKCGNPMPGGSWSDMTDEDLLLAYRTNRDSRPFEELVHRYQRELYSYLRRYLSDPAEAEDAFQGTFLQVHRKHNQFEEGRRVRPWLYTIATNQAIDAQRRNKRHRAVSLDRHGLSDGNGDVGSLVDLLSSRKPGAETNLESDERRDWIRAVVEDLPDTYRGALVLIYYQGIKYRDAAEILGIPVGTVKSRLHAAILKLSEAWAQTHFNDHE